MRVPDKSEHRRRWAEVDLDTRRRVMKAVNGGKALENKADAKLAVGAARQQQRFWSRVWVLGPLSSLLFYRDGWMTVAVNATVAALIMGLMATYWYLKAKRAERTNLEALGIRPEDAQAAEPDADEREEGDGRAGTPHAANPPKRSRRKRR